MGIEKSSKKSQDSEHVIGSIICTGRSVAYIFYKISSGHILCYTIYLGEKYNKKNIGHFFYKMRLVTEFIIETEAAQI
jgi:hypothetical protein